MKTFELKGVVRTTTGKKANRDLRLSGKVPCVLYGGKDNVNFTVDTPDLRHLVYSPNVYMVALNIDGNKHTGVLQAITFHPVTDEIEHIDFKEIFDNKPVIIDIPYKVTGNSIGVKKGGKLKVFKRHLKVKGLPAHLPEEIVSDISDLDVGAFMKAGDIKIPNITILNKVSEQCVAVLYARTVVDTPAEGAAAAPAAAAGAKAAPAAKAPAAAAKAAPAAKAPAAKAPAAKKK